MQNRWFILLLTCFATGASLGRFEAGGVWIAAVILLAAWLLYGCKSLKVGVSLAGVLLLLGLLCPALLLPPVYFANEDARRIRCRNNLSRLGSGLLHYARDHNHFPPAYICDRDGKRLFSWTVALLPYFEEMDARRNEKKAYEALNLEEPWDSPPNSPILSRVILPEFNCPSDHQHVSGINYLAIIGPGTIWRSEGTVNYRDLKNGLARTVALVEIADSDKHWAEPFAVTVEEALERMKTGEGPRISCYHKNSTVCLSEQPAVVNVLLADGSVHSLPAKMPISLWRQILAGEIQNFDVLESQIDPHATDMTDVSLSHQPMQYPLDKTARFWGGIVWLLSVILLFVTAIGSRKMNAPEVKMEK